MISGIVKVEVSVISRGRRLRLITLTEITKSESNNCFMILYLQVISQFLAGSMKRIEGHSYFAVRDLDIAVRALHSVF